MASRFGTVVSWVGILITAAFFVLFARMAFTGTLTWNFWPTLIFVAFGCLPLAIGCAINFIVSGN